MTPKILLAATARWFSTARLAIAFARAGCEIEAVCPPGHPATKTRVASKIHPYHALAPLQSLGTAIAIAKPDLVVPCDDLATSHLHELHRQPDRTRAAYGGVRALVERSLGDPSSFPVARARTIFIALAHELGLKAPLTAVARTEEELTDWLLRNGCPAVLKTDGSYGGKGVRIVRTVTEAVRGWQALSSPPSPARAIKRALINGDTTYVLPCVARTRPVVNVQRYVAGQDANASVACWQGTVLASVIVRVLHTLDQHGPASVVEVFDDRDISGAVAKVVGLLGLSGLAGFDFMIEECTGDPYLIEMNPRATQICHLSLGVGRDLVASLRTALTGELVQDAPRATEHGVIAFFPQEWMRDPASPFLQTVYHDVPWDQPDLIRACMRETIVDRAWSWISSKTLASGAQKRSSTAANDGRARKPGRAPGGAT